MPAPRVPLGVALLALATGGFAIGTTEFVSMGLLPQIASGVGVSIPTAGHAISAYALGVVVGAPLIAFLGARLPRRGLLVGLMVAFAAGHAASALAPGFESLVVARFLAGLPHGAYFGVASLVAASLAPPHRKGRAVAMVMIGLSVANIVGVPAATWLGLNLGWRSAYWAVVGLALLTVVLVLLTIPAVPGDAETSGLRELAALRRPQVQLTLLAGAIGFGGMFAVYSYISPTLTRESGLALDTVPWFLLAFGVGMTVGTWLAGELAHWSMHRSLLIGASGMAASLLVFGLMAGAGWWLLVVCFSISTLSSVLVVNLQLRLMEVTPDAQTIGAAMNHASLNVANALGAWIGGLVLAAGWGYRSPALAGVLLSLLGLGVIAVSLRRHDA